MLRSFLFGRGRPSGLLGYDRRPDMGPWVVRRTVGWLHRHTCLVGAANVQILWNNEEIRLDSPLRDVSASPVRR